MNNNGRQDRKFETLYPEKTAKKLSMGHPKYSGRADRLDLITNRMAGLKASVKGKNFAVCDISETGFSYAEKVPVKKNLSFRQVKLKVDQIAVSNYGKSLKYICFYENETEKGGVRARGTIKNHSIFLILSNDEIKKTITDYLQSISVRRSHDPEGFFDKLDLLISKAEDMRKRGHNQTSLGIALNTSFQNLIMEMGASKEIFETLYQGYINKPVYVKYGVAVDNHKEAADLVRFATTRNSARLKREQEARLKKLDEKADLIKRFNQNYSYKEFVFVVWKSCLKTFQLDFNLELPKIEREEIANLMKKEISLYNGCIEKIIDPDFKETEPKGMIKYIADGLYWHLIDIDKKYFDRNIVIKEVREILLNTYLNCLHI